MSVHNHGTEDGPGLACRERIIDGTLIDNCMTTAPETLTYTLTITDPAHPGRPPLTMNEWRNCHWRRKDDAKKRIHWQVKKALQDASVITTIARAKVTITQFAPNGRRRDVDGLGAFRKDVLDALVRHRVLPDDNTRHVVDGGNFIVVDRDNPRMEIRLEVLA